MSTPPPPPDVVRAILQARCEALQVEVQRDPGALLTRAALARAQRALGALPSTLDQRLDARRHRAQARRPAPAGDLQAATGSAILQYGRRE